MIRCLGTIFHLAETHMDTFCRLTEHLRKELIAHKVRAGTGSQITAILYQLHAAQIDLTVALDGVFHGASGLREGGRIQDHHIVLLALGLQLRKQVKHIGAEEFHLIGKAVKGRVFLRLMNAQLGSIHAQHLFCPGKACIQGKGTGMGKAVQHLRVFRQSAG